MGQERIGPSYFGSEREQMVHSRNDGNPLFDGIGSRRHMRGRSDMVEREHDQGQEEMVWKKDKFIFGINAPYSIL